MARLFAVVSILMICGCGDVNTSSGDCPAGMHADSGGCAVDTTCLSSTCNGHGTCSVVSNAVSCACDAAYGGESCSDCAAGYQDNAGAGACAQGCAQSGLACGNFGSCSDATGTPTCDCEHGATGSSCESCMAPTDHLVWDTFGRAGEHHFIDVAPNDIVVAMLPTDTVGNGGYAGGGEVTSGRVPTTPPGAKFTMAFSHCPGEVTSFARSEVVLGQYYPCMVETTNPAYINVKWGWDGPVVATRCHLPMNEGPWYVNLKVEFDAASQQECLSVAGRCAIDWQWN